MAASNRAERTKRIMPSLVASENAKTPAPTVPLSANDHNPTLLANVASPKFLSATIQHTSHVMTMSQKLSNITRFRT